MNALVWLLVGLASLTPSGSPEPALVVGVAQVAPTWEGDLPAGVRSLRLAIEVRRGYDRDLFRHWVDRDSDGCDTRDEVLIAEATTGPSVGDDCTLSRGSWTSYYDAASTRDSSTLDIDHMVPLAEAWDSGARAWNAGTRERFANDLGDVRSLVAVTASANRSKSDQDPVEWMPAREGCRYVRQYVAVKIRWSLTVDRAEKRFLRSKAASCPDVTLTVRKASIGSSAN
ncbi:MAG: HNH endonuclease family protein [Nocardioides sp.]